MAMKPAYFAQEAWSNLRRNLLMALASVLAVSMCLVLLGSVLLLYRVVKNVTQRWENNVVINVFLKDDASQAQITAAKESIKGFSEVKNLKYVSKEAAYNEFKEMFKDQPELVNNVDKNTLPASFRISLNDPKTLEQVSSKMQKLPGVDEVFSDQEIVKRVQTVLSIVSIMVVAGVVVFLATAVVLISNTIRLAIFARRKEIAIMKLVGATNWFIRWPFMLEGLVQGLIGAFAAILVLWFGSTFLVNYVTKQVPFLPLGIPVGWTILTYVLLLLVGGLIAVGATAFALRRYLEV